jgi:shikimate kinase
MKNIVLIGFMGTGKTVTGKVLAQKLNMKYISTDELIEKKDGRKIAKIFSESGEAYFRKLEKEIIKEVSNTDNSVIDAGGGACLYSENVKNLKEKGIIICLWAEPEVICERTKKCSERPLLNVDKPLPRINDLLDERRPYYERADHHIRNSNMSVEEVVLEIENIIKNDV